MTLQWALHRDVQNGADALILGSMGQIPVKLPTLGKKVSSESGKEKRPLEMYPHTVRKILVSRLTDWHVPPLRDILATSNTVRLWSAGAFYAISL